MESKIKLEDSITQGSSLVALQPEGSRPITYLVHGIAGHLLRIDQLSPYMAPDYPLYGLQAKGLNNNGDHTQSIEEIAADYIRDIQIYQPEGPYYLGGFSFGSYVAFEMAQQLFARGHRVALLAVLDAPASTLPRYSESLNRTQNLIFQGRRVVLKSELEVKHKLRIRSRLRHLLGNRRSSTGVSSNDQVIPSDAKTHTDLNGQVFDHDEYMKREEKSASPYRALMDANISAMKKYAIRPYPGKITLFKAERGWIRTVYGWEALADRGVEVHHIPGNHLTILEEPNVQILAEKLKACITTNIKA